MKTLTVIVPVFNEEERVKKTLSALEMYMPPKGLAIKHVRFVNDGSTDKTLAVLKAWKKKVSQKPLSYTIDIFSYMPNRGRGYAVRLGLHTLDTDYGMFIDGDMSIPIDNLSRFSLLLNRGVDLAFGSKKRPGAVATIDRGFIRKIVGYGHTICASLLLGTWHWDFQGGMKIFSQGFIKDALPYCSNERWGFDMEAIFWAENLKLKTKEVAVVWGCIEDGSKVVLARDIYRALKDMFSIRFQWTRLFILERLVNFVRKGTFRFQNPTFFSYEIL